MEKCNIQLSVEDLAFLQSIVKMAAIRANSKGEAKTCDRILEIHEVISEGHEEAIREYLCQTMENAKGNGSIKTLGIEELLQPMGGN